MSEVAARGDTKATVVGHDGLRFDLRVVPHECYGNVLQHFTGSKDHNIALREDAQRRGLSISEYGVDKCRDRRGRDARDRGRAVRVPRVRPIPPELREGTHEIPAARGEGELPQLVELGDLRGELHCHSTWSSDGKNTTRGDGARREVARLSLPLHHRPLALPPRRTTRRAAEGDRRAERAAPPFRILRGIEVNIRADGSLDVDDEVLADLDWVVASLHTSFDRSPTERILGAMDNPHVDCIGHLTGRRLLKRDGAPVDVERVVEKAAETGTALEINSQPDRLDMRDTHARLAGEAGVRIPITTDAPLLGALAYCGARRRSGAARVAHEGADPEHALLERHKKLTK